MVAAPPLRYTHQQYVAFERSSVVKHEFVRGLILAMAGGKPEHGARAVRVTASLAQQLVGKRCTVFDSDVRVRIPAAEMTAYPDASVVCGRLETDTDDPDAILNPVVLVEVLSPSTEEYDRSDKLEAYQRITSVREIVHVAHDEQRVDVYRRHGEGWSLESYRSGQAAPLESIAYSLEVDDVYRYPLGADR
ncbi:MAG TPA: Uma2 family endonuclease [Polyangiaceae bacterium]